VDFRGNSSPKCSFCPKLPSHDQVPVLFQRRDFPALPMHDKKTIILLIEQIIRSWLEDDYDSLNTCFDDNVVMYLPHSTPHAVGREAVCDCLRSLRAGRIIKRYDQTEFSVSIAGSRAVAFYHYHMKYEENNATCSESGVDFYVFEYREKAWRMRWRSVYTTEDGSNDVFTRMLG
jgi:hypothetical protein